KYKIDKSTLEKWLQQYRSEQSGKPLITGRAITPEQQEIQRLKKEVAQLKLERDILNEE
ncbi:transposase, partial [bacterium M00.F.Ca.ET.230.01.1.1]